MHDRLLALLGEPIVDPEEACFLVFSQAIPSQALGFIDSQASTIDLSVGARDLTIHHSRGLLASGRKHGTTGAVVWKVTPLFADWITSTNFLHDAGYLDAETTALELGAGVSGVVAITLGPRIKRYIATDQDYVMRRLRQNITENLSPASQASTTPRSKHKQLMKTTACRGVETLELDWEFDSVSSLPSTLGLEDGVDLLVACDCIYNEALIEPLNAVCAQICRLRTEKNRRPTLCLLAHQLRSHQVFDSWLESFHRLFHVWQIPDELLTEPLKENSGFIVHAGIVR